MTDLFAIANHPARRAIIVALAAGEEVSAKDMSDKLGLSLGAASYHMSVLRDAGLMRMTRTFPRRGAIQTFYRMNGHRRADFAKLFRAIGAIELVS